MSGFSLTYGQSLGNGIYAATPEQLYAYHSCMMAQSMTCGMENMPYGYYQYAVPYQMYLPQARAVATVTHNTAADSTADSLKHADVAQGGQQAKPQQQKTEGASHPVQTKNPQNSPTFPAMALPQPFGDTQGMQKPYNYEGQIYYPPLAYQISAYTGQCGAYPFPTMSYSENYPRDNYFDSNAYNGQGGSASTSTASTNRGYPSGQYATGRHQGNARARAYSSAQRNAVDKS
ncbi:hypothetical protein V1525DRAFT_395031 [Lipomyces kononenkoae]|uniref:Uncharacterized protein n=1 Tax=Lipomyces kononenkoae TaxID=34357 RepID=A0ACC3T9V0_LIPKO